MKANDLAIHAHVASSKIYAVLQELKTMGAVIELESSPAKYGAQSPRHVLDNLLSEVEGMKDLALKDAEPAFEKNAGKEFGNFNCWSITGISSIKIQLRQLAKDCKKSLKICDPDLNWIGKSESKFLNKLLREKKQLEIIGTEPFHDILEDFKNNGAKVRISNLSGAYYIIDDIAVLLRFNTPDSGVTIKDPIFIKEKVGEFNRIFKSAKEIKSETI